MTHRRCEMKTLTKPSNNNSIGTANTITLSAHRNTIWANAGFRVLPLRCRWLAAKTRSFRNVLPWFNISVRTHNFRLSGKKRKQAITREGSLLVSSTNFFVETISKTAGGRTTNLPAFIAPHGQQPQCENLVNYTAKIHLYTCILDVCGSLQLYTKLFVKKTCHFLVGTWSTTIAVKQCPLSDIALHHVAPSETMEHTEMHDNFRQSKLPARGIHTQLTTMASHITAIYSHQKQMSYRRCCTRN